MIYLVRNRTFEPAQSSSKNYWESTYRQIENAFAKGTPAIISSHRVNFIGSINQENRKTD